MYSGILLLLNICATIFIATAKPTGESLSLKQTLSSAESSTRSVQNGFNNQELGQAQNYASNAAGGSLNSGSDIESDSEYYQMFRFVDEQEINCEEDFNKIIQKLETIIDEQYIEAMDNLKQWDEIEIFAEHKLEAEKGLTIAKEKLTDVISEAGNNLLINLRGIDKTSENYEQEILQLRKTFESQIRNSVIYFIQALEAISATSSKSGSDNESRCLGGTKKLVARSIGSEFINAGVGAIEKGVGAGQQIVNSGAELGGEMMTSAADFGTGMAKKGINYNGRMINEATGAAGGMAKSGIEIGRQGFDSAKGLSEGMAESTLGYGNKMIRSGGSAIGSITGNSGFENGKNCKQGPRGQPHQNGQGAYEAGHAYYHGGKGQQLGQYNGGRRKPQGYEQGYKQGYGEEMGETEGFTASSASSAKTGTVQQIESGGDDYQNNTSNSARSFAEAQSGIESKSLSI